MESQKTQNEILDNLFSKKVENNKRLYYSEDEYDKLGMYGGGYCDLEYDDEEEE